VLLLGGFGGLVYFILCLNRATREFNEHGGHHPHLVTDAFIRRISSAYRSSVDSTDALSHASSSSDSSSSRDRGKSSLLSRNSQFFSVLSANWEIVLLVERTCLILLSVCIHSENLTREIVVTTWCFIMLATHCMISPFASEAVNSLQTMFLSILLMISFLNIPKATFDAAGMTPSVFIQHSFESIDFVEAVLLLLPLVPTFIYLLLKQKRKVQELKFKFDSRGSSAIREKLLSESAAQGLDDDATSLNGRRGFVSDVSEQPELLVAAELAGD
jgi:hypothetical protein